MYAYRTRPLTYPWPPVLYCSAIAAAFLLGRISPVVVDGSHGYAPLLAGSMLIGAAVCLDVWAMRTLADRHTTFLPHGCAAHLVTCGPYRFTRNPIYLGFAAMMAGLGLVTLNPWYFVLAIVTVALVTVFAVRNEELHLMARFGIDYERYCRKTSRWI